VIAAAAGGPGAAEGQVAYCAGGADGPRSCGRLAGTPAGGAPALGVGDVTGDGFSDVVAGRPGAVAGAGAVALWRGSRGGPVGNPQTITQESVGIPGNSEVGDEFGRALVVARVDGDRFLDIVVAAPGEGDARGRITVLHGAPEGYDAAIFDAYGAGSSTAAQGAVPRGAGSGRR
jgi:hypothetical protein